MAEPGPDPGAPARGLAFTLTPSAARCWESGRGAGSSATDGPSAPDEPPGGDWGAPQGAEERGTPRSGGSSAEGSGAGGR